MKYPAITRKQALFVGVLSLSVVSRMVSGKSKNFFRSTLVKTGGASKDSPSKALKMCILGIAGAASRKEMIEKTVVFRFSYFKGKSLIFT